MVDVAAQSLLTCGGGASCSATPADTPSGMSTHSLEIRSSLRVLRSTLRRRIPPETEEMVTGQGDVASLRRINPILIKELR